MEQLFIIMLYLLLSILGSVFVGVLFKFSKQQNTNIFYMVLINYIITSALSYFIFKVDISHLPQDFPFITTLLLGLLLPSIFIAQYYSIVHAGIIRTDVAQRMSLFIPIIAAIFLFKEDISPGKYATLALGLMAVYLILSKTSGQNALKDTKQAVYFPVIVFIGFGVIDILFKQLALYSSIPYTSSLFFVFGFSLFITLLYYATMIVIGKKDLFYINKPTMAYGLVLGGLNFINILFYMKAHQEFASNPTTVFAGMNFGVILLGTLIGYFFFKEKLSWKNVVGILIAVVAISLILFVF